MTMFLAPYTAIADIDGSPLDAGFLYLGEYGKDPASYPVDVYWDAEFTVPAAQPIRTRNGYPVRNGSPAKVYLKTAAHSIAIKNRKGTPVLVDFFNKGWDASFVVTASGKTQQEVNEEQDEKNIEFSNKFLRAQSLADIGYPRQALGYNTLGDAFVYSMMSELEDTDLLVNGGFHVAKKFRGIRRNITPLSIRGGTLSTNDPSAWNAQVVGVSNARGMASYGMNDGVSLYVDATLRKLEDWETIATATYTATTAIIDKTIFAVTLANIKIGDVIQTMHATKCWGIVTGIDESSGIISVDEWATNGTTTVTPANNTGFYVNLISKVWSINANAIVEADATSNVGAVVCEFGLQVKKNVSVKNGIDMVLLGGSSFDGDAAYLARGGANTDNGWLYGFNSQGSRINFMSTSGRYQPYVGFHEQSNAVAGIRFAGRNTIYSMFWAKDNNLANSVKSNVNNAIGPNGSIYKQSKRTLVVNTNISLDSLYPFYLVGASGITLTTPPISELMAGHYYELLFINTGSYTISVNNAETNINGGASSTTISVTEARTKYTLLFDGTYWFLYKG